MDTFYTEGLRLDLGIFIPVIFPRLIKLCRLSRLKTAEEFVNL